MEKCYCCKYFQRYYLKKKIQFVRSEHGYCFAIAENVIAEDYCERFERKEKRYPVNSMVRGRLDTLLKEITTLRCMLQEEQQEENEDENL